MSSASIDRPNDDNAHESQFLDLLSAVVGEELELDTPLQDQGAAIIDMTQLSMILQRQYGFALPVPEKKAPVIEETNGDVHEAVRAMIDPQGTGHLPMSVPVFVADEKKFVHYSEYKNFISMSPRQLFQLIAPQFILADRR